MITTSLPRILRMVAKSISQHLVPKSKWLPVVLKWCEMDFATIHSMG